jgi:hypothetical protein
MIKTFKPHNLVNINKVNINTQKKAVIFKLIRPKNKTCKTHALSLVCCSSRHLRTIKDLSNSLSNLQLNNRILVISKSRFLKNLKTSLNYLIIATKTSIVTRMTQKRQVSSHLKELILILTKIQTTLPHFLKTVNSFL